MSVLCLSATTQHGMVSSNQVYPAQTLTYGNIFLLLIPFLMCFLYIMDVGRGLWLGKITYEFHFWVLAGPCKITMVLKESQVRKVCVCVCVLVTQSCPTLCSPIDCSQPGSSVHGILQERILEWVAISFSRGSSQSRDWTWVSCFAGSFLKVWATKGDQVKISSKMHHSLIGRGLLSTCTLVQRNKKQVGDLPLISTPTVCQALCPAPQRHDLIFLHDAEKFYVCFESPVSGVVQSELSPWHVGSREHEEMSRWIFLTLLGCWNYLKVLLNKWQSQSQIYSG